MTEGALVLGILNGLLFGLLGLGIVLVYKANRFLNLAYAQLGAVPAVVLAKLVIQWGWAWWAAFPVCVAAGIAIGVGVDRFFVSPLRRRSASAVAPLLLTVGVGEVLLAVTYIPALGASPNRLAVVGYPLPFHAHATIGSVVLGGQDILTLILAPAIVGALALWLRYSMLGKQIRAAASNPNAARLAGVRIARVSAITWGIAGALSAITAILQAPAQGTFNAATLGPELLLIALGAALVGAFTSIPGALVGGLVLGLVQQITLGITSNGGTAEVVVVIAILAVVLVRGRAIAGVWGTGGAAAPMAPLRLPAPVADRWMVVRQRPLLAGTAAAVALLLPALPPLHAESRRFELTLIVMWALVGVSLVVLVGWAGQVSLGHFALVGIGAFVTARLGNDHMSLIVIVVAAAAAGALALVIVGLPALRVPGLSLAVTSIGLAVITPDWLLRQPWLGSTNVFATPVHPAAVIAGLGRPASEASAYYVALGLLTVTVAGLATLRRSRLGRAVIAVHDNEAAAATFGVTPAATRVSALAVSGAIAGAAGVVWALAWRSVAPTQFTPDLSISALAAPIIGGIASVSGAVAGAVALYAATFFASPHLTGLFGSFGHQIGFELAVGGAGVVLTVLWLPAGLAGAARRRWQQFLDHLAATATETANETATHVPPALIARDIRLAFGGVLALTGATIEVRPGEIVGIIGPNGAGKSTLMNVVSGALRAHAGEVRLFGRVATDLPPEVRAGLGLGRSFQDARLFRDLTVIEAVQVALDRYHPAGAVSSALRLPWARQAEARSRQEAVDIVTRFGLDAWSDTLVSDLSTGTRRVCDVAMQVAGRPRLLLLDEPTAGVAQRDAESFGPLLRQVRDELDCAILVIEHDLPMLMGLCDRVYAMDGGRVIAEGTPDEVRHDPTVIATYLGTGGVAVGRSERRARKAR